MSYTSKDMHMKTWKFGPKTRVKSWGDTPQMFVEDALVCEYEQFAEEGGLACRRSRCTNASKTFDRRMYRRADVLLMR